jgi:hypothetical protein
MIPCCPFFSKIIISVKEIPQKNQDSDSTVELVREKLYITALWIARAADTMLNFIMTVQQNYPSIMIISESYARPSKSPYPIESFIITYEHVELNWF